MPDPNLPCIYCLGQSGEPKFSLEHIWPRALGGVFMPKLFKTDQVCIRCNSRAGQFVDASFLKSWFIAADNTFAAHRFLDKDNPTAIPLLYMGIAQDFPCEADEVCERWIGPAGDSISHIHKRDGERWDTFAGGDMIARKRDPGRAYISFASSNQYWVICSIKSFMARFDGAVHRSTTQIDGLPADWGLLNPHDEPLSERERRDVEFIRGQSPAKHTLVPTQIDFADRFLCKLALGLAFNILGSQILRSPYVSELRRGLWMADFEERQRLQVRGTSFWKDMGDDRFRNLMHWPGAWVIMLSAFPEGFGLLLVMPGGRQIGRLIAEGHKGWAPEAGPTYGQGKVYVVVPQRQTVIGPLSFLEYISFKAGLGQSSALDRLKAMEVDLKDLPPKR